MTDVHDDLSHVYLAETVSGLDVSLDKIKHCVAQLGQQQLWWRPHESQNSIANIILHLCGNLRQRFRCVVVGEPDTRDRPAEFSERGPIPKDELIKCLDAAIQDAKDAVDRLNSLKLTEHRTYQGLGRTVESTVLGVILRTLVHLGGHTQEIVYATRLQLGDDYQFHAKPVTN